MKPEFSTQSNQKSESVTSSKMQSSFKLNETTVEKRENQAVYVKSNKIRELKFNEL
jgi:hypothetical protein